jgi:zinc transport system permease protein
MLSLFQYSFIQRAFEAGIIISIIAPLVGTFLVAKKYSLLADGLSHVALAGIAIGLLSGIYPLATAIIVSIIAGFIIESIRSKKLASGDTALAMFISGGLGLAVVLMSIGNGFNVDLLSYLFGSITTVTVTDVYTITIIGIIVILAILGLYKQLLYVSFDEESAKVSGIKTNLINYGLIIVTSVTVVLSMRIVGALLIGALMVIPVVVASQFKKNFAKTMLISVVTSIISVIIGLLLSYYFNLAAGVTIVVVSLIIFGISVLLNK